MQRLLAFSCLLLLAPGCAISQLKRSSSQIGVTVDDVITQQVLDNLAKFKQNPEAIPHFAYPAGAQSTARHSLSASPAFNFTRWTLGGWGFGVAGSRDDSEGFTMQPVTDPYKLDLMRCLYQQAVCRTSADCPDCSKRYNKFYFGSEDAPQTIQLTPSGHRVYWWSGEEVIAVNANGKSEIPAMPSDFSFRATVQEPEYLRAVKNQFGVDTFWSLDGSVQVIDDEEQIGALLAAKKLRPVYMEDSLTEFSRRTGRITPACLSCGWVKCGDVDGVRGSRCCLTGEYCGTEIWVPESCRDQLSVLTLLVLEIARHDPAVTASVTKPEQHEILLTLANLPSSAAEAISESGNADENQGVPTPDRAPFRPQMKWNNLSPQDFERPQQFRFNPLSGTDGAVDAILNERARETLVR